MSFEQFQNEDGKNIINITGVKHEAETPKTNPVTTENIINEAFLPNALEEQLQKTSTSLIIDELKKIEMGTSVNTNHTELKPLYYRSPIETVEDVKEIKEEYTKREYYTLSAILFSLILLVVLFILYQKGI